MSEVFHKEVIKLKRRRPRYVQKEKEPWTKTAFRIFKLFIPFLILSVYVLAAAGLFYAYESECGNNFACPLTNIQYKGLYVDTVHSTSTEFNLTKADQDKALSDNNGLQGKKSSLSYSQAIDFIVISVTTIGYGDIVPCTTEGEVIVICISLIGLPIMIIALNRIGKLIGMVLHNLWGTAYTAMFKPPYKEERRLQLNSDYVPLSLALVVATIYILICSLYFYADLKSKYTDRTFTYFTAVYFTLITFLTVGYGDIAPIDYNMIFLNLFLIFIGLAIVALVIRIVRIELEEMASDLVAMIEKKFVEAVTDKRSPSPAEEEQEMKEGNNRISVYAQASPETESIELQFPEELPPPRPTYADGSSQTIAGIPEVKPKDVKPEVVKPKEVKSNEQHPFEIENEADKAKDKDENQKNQRPKWRIQLSKNVSYSKK